MNIVNFGSLNIDYTFQVNEIVRPGQTIDSLQVSRFPGGKGLNQSLALARAGGRVFHAGIIGKDGLFLKDLLEKDGVDCGCIRISEEADTGKAFIQVDKNGQNSIVLSGGANKTNSPAFCRQVLDRFSAGDWLLVQNEISCIPPLMRLAHEKGMEIIFNPSPIDGSVMDFPLDTVSLFLLNEDEGARLTGEAQPDQILSAMAKNYPRAQVILTLGEKGSLWSDGREQVFQEAFPALPVDTTGAGDTFTGYVLACLSRGEGIRESMRTAARAAAVAVTRRGAASAIPYPAELQPTLAG